MVRRSMPWGTPSQHGLYFVAYGRSLDAFERVLTRMAGIEDGMRDALFSFTHPVTGGYYWCPPVLEGRLDCAPSTSAKYVSSRGTKPLAWQIVQR